MKDLRRAIIETAYAAQEGHIPSALSILDIVWVLYDRVLKPADRFILSKGHGCLALYAVLAEKGFFPAEELKRFASFGGMLGGHPHCKVPGIEASTGSLGHGLPIAVGIALGLKIQRNSARVCCLIGDGEANEGSIWEAAALAAHHNLSNLTCIVDANFSSERALKMRDIGEKFEAFGWDTTEIDGHNHGEIFHARRWGPSDRPFCIIANTIKGHGCKPMENNPAWHRRAPNDATELKLLLEGLS